MAARHSVRREAARDLAAAFDWYEAQSPGLGFDFLVAFRECVATISRHPEMCAAFHKNYRRAVVGRFSYVIYYLPTPNHVSIHAVLHTARDPKSVQRRLP